MHFETFFSHYIFISSLSSQQLQTSSPFLKRVSIPLGSTDEIRCRDFSSNKNSSDISRLLSDYFTHCPRISRGIYLVVGERFCSCRYQSVSCDTKQRVTILASSRSTLNLCPPRFCFSGGRRWQFLGEEFTRYNHKQCVCFSDEIMSCKIIFWRNILYLRRLFSGMCPTC
jgi:hypothetical protein